MGDEGSADPGEGEPWGRGFRSLPDPMKGAEGKPVIHKPQDKYSRRWEQATATAFQWGLRAGGKAVDVAYTGL